MTRASLKYRHRIAFALAAPIVVLLAGCTPTAPTPAPTVTVTAAAPTAAAATPTATPTPTAAAAAGPTEVNAADYLVSGHPHHPDANGEWSANYAFYTDSSKNVFCEITLFSGSQDEGGCWITSPAANAQVTFTAPASQKSQCGTNGGYGAQIGGGAGLSHLVNWWGCYRFTDVVSPKIAAKTLVIPDNSILTVSPLTAVVVGGASKFTIKGHANASLTFGMNVADLLQ